MVARPVIPANLADRFWSKVQKADGDGCWIWIGATDGDGYGNINLAQEESEDRRSFGAHQVGFYLATGRWPTGLVLHRCDNRPCVRSDHLFEGTQADNIHDMLAKGRGRHLQGHCVRGHPLTGDNVRTERRSGRQKGQVGRRCRRCDNERQSAAYHQRKRRAKCSDDAMFT